MAANGSRWYVVQTHVNAEVKAAANLERQGFAVYLPRFLKRRRGSEAGAKRRLAIGQSDLLLVGVGKPLTCPITQRAR